MLETPTVLYEDSSILVINKPSGLVVNKAETVRESSTVMDWLVLTGRFTDRLEMLGAPPPTVPKPLMGTGTFLSRSVSSAYERTSEFEMRRGIIHRLDKGTSGVMVVAKTKSAFEKIQAQFKERKVSKEYLTLIHADGLKNKILDSKSKRFIVDAPIGRNPRNRLKWAVMADGRNAITEFEVETIFSSSVALLHCFPKTGRTHQIRVHLAAINCSVVCDKLYSNRGDYKNDSKWCPRIFLHASKLSFTHPDSDEKVEFVAPLPDDLQKVLEKLR